MILVRVELHSAITGKVTEIARMKIINDGTAVGDTRGNYIATTLRGADAKDFDKRNPTTLRETTLQHWPRMQKHVWYLVARLLDQMGYGPEKV